MKRFLPLVALLLVPVCVFGQDRNPLRKLDEKIPVKTTGGLLFWGDVLFFHDWHIQKNSVTGTYRLLDGNTVQRALGSYDDCRERLEEIQVDEGILPMAGTALIILHGFGANPLATRIMADWFTEQGAYDYVFNAAYPSTTQPIFKHARMLRRIVHHLPPTVRRIDFVGHSLGSIVVRRYLSGPLEPDWEVPEDRLEARKHFSPDPRIGRFVMLGPPNHGSEIARKMIGHSPLRRRLGGESGDELGIHWSKTEKMLGIPCCSFGILAGGRGDDRGYSLLIDGDDDGVVSTEGTRLEGADGWIQFPVGHGEMLLTEEVFEAALRFLQTGSFEKTDRRLKP